MWLKGTVFPFLASFLHFLILYLIPRGLGSAILPCAYKRYWTLLENNTSSWSFLYAKYTQPLPRLTTPKFSHSVTAWSSKSKNISWYPGATVISTCKPVNSQLTANNMLLELFLTLGKEGLSPNPASVWQSREVHPCQWNCEAGSVCNHSCRQKGWHALQTRLLATLFHWTF